MTQDIYQTVTDQLVRMIESGAGKWRMPWHTDTASLASLPVSMPHNVTGRAYRGINVPILWGSANHNGYASPIWATYKQWSEQGSQVRKGEKSTTVIFWKSFAVKNKDTDEDETRMTARSYAVFNAAQVDGYTVPTIPEPATDDETRIASAESYFRNVGAVVRHGGNRAFYAPSQDSIQMPTFGQFRDPISYYATLAHEHIHWTGHEKRCNREFGKRFGNESYAMEELVAELGAAFVCAQLGLSNNPRPDHAAYLDSWLKVLKADKRAIFTAASKAQAAADYLAQSAAIEEDAIAA